MSVNYCSFARHLYHAAGDLLEGYCPESSPGSDGILLTFGQHQVEVKVDNKVIDEVFLSVQDEGLPVCGSSPVSTAGVIIGDNGFIIVVNVQSDSCLVKWIVK